MRSRMPPQNGRESDAYERGSAHEPRRGLKIDNRWMVEEFNLNDGSNDPQSL
jgi:hypothetical protein